MENGEYHPWVKAIFQVARTGTVFQTAAHYPILMKLLLALAPKKMMEERMEHMEMTKAKLRRRMEGGKERPDLVEGLLKKKEEWVSGISSPELRVVAMLTKGNRDSHLTACRPTAAFSSLADLRPRRHSSLA